MGATVGEGVGDNLFRTPVGSLLGKPEGLLVGSCVGEIVGETVGLFVGATVGEGVGEIVGALVGEASVGDNVFGTRVGSVLGKLEGLLA